MRNTEKSYGILLYRKSETVSNSLEFFLIKPNAPGFWTSRNDVWGFPKGRAELGEQPFVTAVREFREEVGMFAPEELKYSRLEPFVTSYGKTITIFSGDATGHDVQWCGSNTAEAEYPSGSGNIITYSETITGGWFPQSFALEKLEGEYKKLINQVIRMERMKKIVGKIAA